MRNIVFALSASVIALASCATSHSTGDTESVESKANVAPTPVITEPTAVTASAPTQEGTLDDAAEQYQRRQQKRALLIEQYQITAEEKIARLRFDEAAESLQQALLLDPENQDVRTRLLEVRQLMGEENVASDLLALDLERQYELKRQQLRVQAENAIEKGKRELARGDYDAAIAEFSLARAHAEWAPLEMQDSGLADEANSLLADARSARDESIEQQREAERAETAERLRAEREAETARRRLRVDTILEQGIGAFDAGSYDQAIALASRVIDEEPQNERAWELRDAAFQAGRDSVQRSYIDRKREEFKRWEQQLRALRIPNTEIIDLPDAERWQQNAAQRGQATLGGGLESSPADQALRRLLSDRTIPGLVIEDEESLNAVIENVRAVTGLGLVVDPTAEEAAFDEGAIFNYRLENPMSVDRVLNIITNDAGEEVTWTVRHETVLITTREKAQGQFFPEVHDVQDILFSLTNFTAPRLDRIRLLEELFDDDDGGGPFGGLAESQVLIEPDTLESLVRENVGIGTWDDDGISLQVLETGYLVAVHTSDVQSDLRQFLDDLRRFNSSLVTIESKFLTVADNYIQEIGVEWRGLDNPGDPFTDLDDVTNGLEDNANAGFDNGGTGVDVSNAAGPPSAGFFYDDGLDGDFKGSTSNIFGSALGDAVSTIGGFTSQWTILDDLQLSMILRMIEKSEKIELVNDQQLSVFNTQRAYVSVINQRAYIQDFDVEVATGQSIADPVINVLIEGVVLEVRPTITQDRRYIRMEIRPTVAEVASLTPFSTNLGGTVGQPVEFELPELEVQSIATTAVIPDGGSILLGGLNTIRNVERRAEVPWLAKIPVVGFFFKEEGYNDEKESLMILIKAWLTDVRDEGEKLDAR
ncbi:MAG: type II secretion system protein GspD [Planctomycetota bacterium]|jgi:type II secretory pathway component GspD/PulD (secretin)/tetratricopeptide (TPR) repeat protein